MDPEGQQPAGKYQRVENCALGADTTAWSGEPAELPVTEWSFDQTFNFKHTASVRELRKQALCIRLVAKKSKSTEPQLVSIYRVDLFTLAIGPVHHAIDLMKGENGLLGFSKQQKYVGRLTADINFT